MRAVPPLPIMTGKRFFSAEQRGQLAAVMEAIWPGGDDNPGATDAGAADYVDQLLGLPDEVYYDIPNWRPRYADGLARLAAAAVERFGPTATLQTLPLAHMTALIGELAAGTLPAFADAASQKAFFNVLRGHCIEAGVADPRWGGNRDGVIWKWLGYPTGQARAFDRSAGGLQ
jgi:gluconate 2-dehydrogenase gamma chain